MNEKNYFSLLVILTSLVLQYDLLQNFCFPNKRQEVVSSSSVYIDKRYANDTTMMKPKKNINTNSYQAKPVDPYAPSGNDECSDHSSNPPSDHCLSVPLTSSSQSASEQEELNNPRNNDPPSSNNHPAGANDDGKQSRWGSLRTKICRRQYGGCCYNHPHAGADDERQSCCQIQVGCWMCYLTTFSVVAMIAATTVLLYILSTMLRLYSQQRHQRLLRHML